MLHWHSQAVVVEFWVGLSDYPSSSLPIDMRYFVFYWCDGGIDKLACVNFRSLGVSGKGGRGYALVQLRVG